MMDGTRHGWAAAGRGVASRRRVNAPAGETAKRAEVGRRPRQERLAGCRDSARTAGPRGTRASKTAPPASTATKISRGSSISGRAGPPWRPRTLLPSPRPNRCRAFRRGRRRRLLRLRRRRLLLLLLLRDL